MAKVQEGKGTTSGDEVSILRMSEKDVIKSIIELQRSGDKFDNNKVSQDIDKLFTDKSIEHLEKVDGFDKKHGGIKGAHTLDSFNKFSKEVRPVVIVGKERISDGIYEIKYKVAKMEKGKPVLNADGTYDLVNKEYVKTVVDLFALNGDKLVSMAKEAFDAREEYITPGNQIYINGISKDGVKFEGQINPITKELDSFYPVKQWQFEY